MIAEDAFDTRYVGKIRDAVRDGLRIYLYDRNYAVLQDEEKFHLMAEEITKRICLSKFWSNL